MDYLTDACSHRLKWCRCVLVLLLALLPTAERRADRCSWQTWSWLREWTSLLTTWPQLTQPPDQRRRCRVGRGAEALWEGSCQLDPYPLERATHKKSGSSLEEEMGAIVITVLNLSVIFFVSKYRIIYASYQLYFLIFFLIIEPSDNIMQQLVWGSNTT